MSFRKLPVDELERVIRERVDRIVRDFLRDLSGLVEGTASILRPEIQKPGEYLTPPFDVYSRAGEVIVVAQIPGASKNSIDIRVRDSSVELEAPLNPELVEKAGESTLLKHKGYRCSIPLPEAVDPSGAKAAYRDGVLILRLPVQKPKGVKIEVE